MTLVIFYFLYLEKCLEIDVVDPEQKRRIGIAYLFLNIILNGFRDFEEIFIP